VTDTPANLTPRERRFAAAFIVTCVLALFSSCSRAATAEFNGMSCALPTGVNIWTAPLSLPACSGYYICAPAGTTYLDTRTLVVTSSCANDRVFSGGFE
jgi:hypothetical protein